MRRLHPAERTPGERGGSNDSSGRVGFRAKTPKKRALPKRVTLPSPDSGEGPGLGALGISALTRGSPPPGLPPNRGEEGRTQGPPRSSERLQILRQRRLLLRQQQRAEEVPAVLDQV